LQPGQTVCLDDVEGHEGAAVRERIAAVGRTPRFPRDRGPG